MTVTYVFLETGKRIDFSSSYSKSNYMKYEYAN
jgi:hypothetical protein